MSDTRLADIEANKQVVIAFWQAMLDGNQKVMDSLLSDDLCYFCAGDMQSCRSFTKAEYFEQMQQVMVDNIGGAGSITIGDITAEGDRVAAEIESKFPLKSGKTYNNHYIFLYYVRDGIIYGLKEYCDTLHAHDVLSGSYIKGPRIARESNIWNKTAELKT